MPQSKMDDARRTVPYTWPHPMAQMAFSSHRMSSPHPRVEGVRLGWGKKEWLASGTCLEPFPSSANHIIISLRYLALQRFPSSAQAGHGPQVLAIAAFPLLRPKIKSAWGTCKFSFSPHRQNNLASATTCLYGFPLLWPLPIAPLTQSQRRHRLVTRPSVGTE